MNSLERKPVFKNLEMIKRVLNEGSALDNIFLKKIETIYSDINTDQKVKNLIDNIIYDK